MLSVIEKYSQITNINLQELMQAFITFQEGDYQAIYNYFSGNSDNDIPSQAFKTANRIKEQAENAISIIAKFNLQKLEEQDLLYDLEQIVAKIKTTLKLNKYLRTDISANGVIESGVNVEYILGQNETLQDVARDVLGSDDETNDWVNIAVRNNVREQDYTVAGGFPLKFKRFDIFSQSEITAVVGGANGDEALGRDIFKKLTYQDEDLLALNPENTAIQAVDIYNKLVKNDIPQYPDLGLDRRLFSGISRNAFSLPILLRQLGDTYKQDDTILDFELLRGDLTQDAFFAEVSVTFVTQQTRTFVIR